MQPDSEELKNAIDEIAKYTSSPDKKYFNSERSLHYWKPSSNNVNSEGISIEAPARKELINIISHFIKSSNNLSNLSKTLHQKIYKCDEGRGLLSELIYRLYISVYYHAISADEIKLTLLTSISDLLKTNQIKHEYLVALHSVPIINDIVHLDEDTTLEPLGLGTLKFLTATSMHHGWGKQYDPLAEHQPLLRFSIRKGCPPPFGNMNELLLMTKAELSLNLAFRRPAFLVSSQCPPFALDTGVTQGTIRNTPHPLWIEATSHEIGRLKEYWELLSKFDLKWHIDNEGRLPIAIRRFQSSLSEPAPEACLALIISAETLLNIQGDTNELSFRYSLMAAHALGEDPESRRRVYKDFRDAYGFRSKTVHGTTSKVDNETIGRLKDYISLLLVKAIRVQAAKESLESWVRSILDAAIECRPFR